MSIKTIKCVFSEEEIDFLIKTLSEADSFNNTEGGDLITYLNNRKDEGKLPPCGHDSCRG